MATMESLGLAERAPSCYTYHERTKKFRWAAGYEDDGPLAHQRQFPVTYCDGKNFPREKNKVDWLGIEDVESFDEKTPFALRFSHRHGPEILERPSKRKEGRVRLTRWYVLVENPGA